MRFFSFHFIIITSAIFLYFCHGFVSGLSSFKSSNTSEKQPWVSMPQFSTSKHSHHQNFTFDDKKVTERNALAVAPQKDDFSTTKDLQDLYHEAYLLLKDVIKARKLNKNTSNIHKDVNSNPKGLFFQNKTFSSRQAKLLGQSPLPPFKTRQKMNSTSFPVTNYSEITAKNTSNRKENKPNGYLKISTVDQANLVQALLAQKWMYNTTEADKMSSTNGTKHSKNTTEREDGKTQFSENITKDNDWTKNTSSGFHNNSKAQLKTRNTSDVSSAAFKELRLVLKTYDVKNELGERHKINNHTQNQTNSNNQFGVNKNSSRPYADVWTSVNNFDKSHTSNSSQKYTLLTQEIVVETGEKRDQRPDDICTTGAVRFNETLTFGLHAGTFTEETRAKTMEKCISYCCSRKSCDVVFMLKESCFLVKCHNKSSCHSRQAKSLSFNPRLAYVFHRAQHDENGVIFSSRPVEREPEQVSWFCKDSNMSKIFTNVELRHGLQAGNITSKGAVTSYRQCVGHCCQDKRCNVAMILRNNCFLVACKTYTSCLPQEATDKSFPSQIVYVNWELPSEKVLTKGKILYKHLGCWHEDERSKSLMSLEGSDEILMDSYKSRRNAIVKCATAARKRNFKVFALHDGGECRSGRNTENIYQSHGRSHGCHKGVGDHVSNHVYHIKENGSVEDHGCWKAIQREENFVTLESIDGRTKEKYKERNDSLLKCGEAAITNQYTLFALRDGGQCLAGSLESTAYKKHGVSKLCANGLGSSSSKNIYQIIGTTQLFLEQSNKNPFLTRNTKKRQHATQANFVQSKLPSLQLPYKHSSPQSRIFTHGLRAGHFTHQGEVNNMAECIQHCGRQPNCSAAFMVRQSCFTVECYSERSCDTTPAVDSGYNPKVAFITHLSPAVTSYKDKAEMKLYESRPFGSKSQKNRQQKVNKSTRASAWRLTSKNSSTFPYKHSSPQSRVFTHGLRAGHFTHHGKVNNMAECIQHCGQQPNCSAAFMVRQFCFTVECYSERSCDTTPAVDSGYNPKVAFITHLLPPATSQPEHSSRRCEGGSKIYENVTLFGGINAGNFTDFGSKENMSECISSCCQQKHCDVAFMLGNDCYGVKCKTKHLCGTTPAKHVKKYRPRLAYMHSNMENNTADSQSLSSCWNGETLVNYTLTGGIDAGIFYSNGNTDSMTTCMKYCCEQHDCDLAFRIDQGCYTVHCKDQKQCEARKARKTNFIPEIAFKRPEVAMDEGTTDTVSKVQHGSCQIGETHFNATLKMGMHSGKFKKLGQVDNMEDCIEMCCKENNIDAAFMLGKHCYSVKCYNSDLCQIRPAFVSSIKILNVNPAVAFIHNDNDHKDYTRSEIEKRCEGTTIKENSTVLGKLQEGAFIDNGERSNIQDCISACCDSPSCDIALMNGKRCFSVQCGRNATSCKEVPADSSPNASTLAYVARFVDTEHAQELELSASMGQCPRESLNDLRVHKNKTLLGGFESGNYTFLGRTKNMQQCVQKCCTLGKCDVAYSIDGNCYGIECFSDHLCHVGNEVPDTTSTKISIIKDLKIKQPRRLSRYFLPVLSLLLAILILIAWLSWLRSRKISSSKSDV